MGNDSTARPDTLLHPEDGPAYEIYNHDASSGLVIIADHASNRVPAALGRLGLGDEHFRLHISHDIGTDSIVRKLADKVDAVAVISRFSRLVIDLNRQPGDPQSVPETSDGIKIPGNMNLSPDEIKQRIDEIFTPYHGAIDEQIMRLWRLQGKPPAIFSVHSFTPTMNGQDRLWDVGVLWNRDPRMAQTLIESLGRWGGLNVGDNEPYSGRDLAYSIDHHGTAGGLATAAVEIRQDHCATEEEAKHWADILSDSLLDILSLPYLHQIIRY